LLSYEEFVGAPIELSFSRLTYAMPVSNDAVTARR
jgi:hypothetical protein